MHPTYAPKTLALLVAACFQMGVSQAQVSLPAVVVTADQIESAAEIAHEERHNSPNAKTVIEAEQLNQFGDQPLGDALRRLVGVAFDGANRAREIQLRNIGVEYTQVTINGRRILDGNAARTVQVDRIPSSLVERIEIIHTPLASMDAQGAAGTVNIVLKQGAENVPNEIGIGMGYLNENGAVGDATVFYTAGDERVRLTLSGGIQQQRRNESKDVYAYTGANVANGGTLTSNKRRYEQANITPRIDINIDKRNSLVIEPMYLRTVEFRDDVTQTMAANQASITQTVNEFRKRTRENAGLYTNWRHELTDSTEITSYVDLQSGIEDTGRDASTYNAAGVLTQTRQRTEDVALGLIKLGLTGQTRLTGHTLGYGVGHTSEKRDEDNSDVRNGVTQTPTLNRRFNVQEDILSLYAQDSFSPLKGNLVTLGIRGESALTQTTDYYGAGTQNRNGNLLSSLSVRQELDPSLDLRFGLAQTLRRPNLRELSPTVATAAGTYASPDVGGNPDAAPEKILGLDVAVDRFIYGRKGLLSAKAFARQFDDKLEVIYASESGRIVTRPQNVGDGRMSGFELEARLPLEDIGLRHVTAWSNLTTVNTQVTSRQTGETRRFLDQADQVGNLGLDWFIPGFKTTLGASLNYNSGYRQRYLLASGSSVQNDVGSMTRMDLSARTQLSRNTTLNISALNVFARAEKRVDETFNAAGVSTGYSATKEPTYQSLYVRVSHRF